MYQGLPCHQRRTELQGLGEDERWSKIMSMLGLKFIRLQTYSGHAGIDLDTVVVKIRISVPLQHTDTMVNGLNALLWASDSEFNHVCSLELCQ